MIIHQLQKILTDQQIRLAGEQDRWGNSGSCVVYPHSEQEIAAVLAYAAEHNLTAVPESGGTKRGWGGTMETADLVISLAEMKGIIEHSVGDMTMTVLPGTTMEELSRYLQPHKQMLPLDPPWPEQATIGGVVAANEHGPKRMRYGSARDLVIGLRVVYPDGRIIRCGGKVVKNVAGYDMNKLFVGSMGTLGIISEITVKLRPLPKCESLVLVSFPRGGMDDIRSFVTQIQDSMIEPVSLELICPSLSERLTGSGTYTLAISFEDTPKAVAYQEDWIKRNCPGGGELHILRQDEAKEWWARFYRIPPAKVPGRDTSENAIALKIGSKNMDVLPIVDYCHRLQTEGIQIEAHGGAGHGITRVYIRGDSARYPEVIGKIRSFATEKGGYAIVQHAPLELRRKVPVWGEKPAYFSILEGIKQAIDPKRVLNPKRFVGGL